VKRRWIVGLVAVPLGLLAAAAVVLRFVVVPSREARRNPVVLAGPHRVLERAAQLHHDAFVADLHADSLLWGRDLSVRGDRGHVDVPRLREAGVDLQVFGVVTQVPKGLNFESNPSDTDQLPLLFASTWRGPASWFDPRARALAQASELESLSRRTNLRLVRTGADLDVAGPMALLGLEGMHALRGDRASLDTLFNAGFRMMGLAHFFDNEVAGSAHGIAKHGLTPLGRQLVPRMEALGITVDLAHASPAAFDDTLALATRPVVVSHTGVRGTCPGTRNLSDAQLRAVARNGGVVGIAFFDATLCDVSPAGIVAAIRHTIEVAGPDHVALGSDFDGAIAAPFDVTGLVLVTQGLLDAGLSEENVRKVLGGNVHRVLARNLPR
jgi:microsomal dipeptidase-like Zn-dependent dipeptidase